MLATVSSIETLYGVKECSGREENKRGIGFGFFAGILIGIKSLLTEHTVRGFDSLGFTICASLFVLLVLADYTLVSVEGKGENMSPLRDLFQSFLRIFILVASAIQCAATIRSRVYHAMLFDCS